VNVERLIDQFFGKYFWLGITVVNAFFGCLALALFILILGG
jgi:hypothetical protein